MHRAPVRPVLSVLVGLVIVVLAWGCPAPPAGDAETARADGDAPTTLGDDTREDPNPIDVIDGIDPIDALDSSDAHDPLDGPDIEVTGACTPAACADDNPCSDDRCQPDGQCAHTPNIALCDDGDACTAFDRCNAGVCVGVSADCDDGSPCTADHCVGGGCVHDPVDGPCDDGSMCTAGDRCHDGLCAGSAISCPGGGPCAQASCEPRGGCRLDALAEGEACDDGDACTDDARCTAGVCRGALSDCDDADPCSDDYCDPATGCSHRHNRAACDDGDGCTSADRCSDGACRGVASEGCCDADGACDDGDPCSDDRCADGRCGHLPRDCDDGDDCTRDVCQSGICASSPWVDLTAEGLMIADFEGGEAGLAGWTFESDNAWVGWRPTTSWAAAGTTSLYCGDAAGLGYDHGATRARALIELLVPPREPVLHLVTRRELAELGSCLYDVLAVVVDGVVVATLCGSGEGESQVSLAGFEGRQVELGLVFDTVDGVNNDAAGVWIDRLRVTAAPCLGD